MTILFAVLALGILEFAHLNELEEIKGAALVEDCSKTKYQILQGGELKAVYRCD